VYLKDKPPDSEGRMASGKKFRRPAPSRRPFQQGFSGQGNFQVWPQPGCGLIACFNPQSGLAFSIELHAIDISDAQLLSGFVNSFWGKAMINPVRENASVIFPRDSALLLYSYFFKRS
jgi:hypothetical protein